jgi:hypothetical protein
MNVIVAVGVVDDNLDHDLDHDLDHHFVGYFYFPMKLTASIQILSSYPCCLMNEENDLSDLIDQNDQNDLIDQNDQNDQNDRHGGGQVDETGELQR